MTSAICGTAESDYLSLGSAIDSITYENQNTQLSDRVYEAVQKLHESDANQFCRVVIISDGVDDKQIGYTHTELENLLRSCGYPIYTVGAVPMIRKHAVHGWKICLHFPE